MARQRMELRLLVWSKSVSLPRAAVWAAAFWALAAPAAVAQTAQPAKTPAAAPAAKESRSADAPTPVAEREVTLVVLDKFTSITKTLKVKPGDSVDYGRLTIWVRTCEAAPPWERPESAAFLQIDERTLQGRVRRVYSGWMFARAPALHPLDHSAYDVSVKNCKMTFPERGPGTTVAAAPAPKPKSAPETTPSEPAEDAAPAAVSPTLDAGPRP